MEFVIDKGVIYTLLKLVHSKYSDIAEVSIKCITNIIVFYNEIYRNMILEYNILNVFAEIVRNGKDESVLKVTFIALKSIFEMIREKNLA